jgi:hypothetical protein
LGKVSGNKTDAPPMNRLRKKSKINLNKEVKDLYKENNEERKLKKKTRKWKDPHACVSAEYCENGYTTNTQTQCNAQENHNVTLHRSRKTNPKIHMEA